MNFTIPKKKYMNEICATVKKLYKLGFYNFVSELGLRIFFITDDNENFILIADPDSHKIDIFTGEAGFATCHFLLSGDNRGTRSFGLTGYAIEETTVSDDNYCGINHYLENFKHYEADEDLYVTYFAFKPGQRPIALEEDEVIMVNSFLNKLLIVVKELKGKKDSKTFDVNTVCVCDFTYKKDNFEVDFVALDSFDFFPTLTTSSKDENMIADLENIEVKSGVMHIGMIYGFNDYDSYNDLTDFKVTLCPIILYGITEEGEVTHQIYSTPFDRRQAIFNAIATIFFKEVGIYDTIITDNLFVYNSLCSSLLNIGVDIKLESNNPFNTFITKFMIKMIEIEDDVHSLDEVLTKCRKDVKELVMDSIDDLEELNERFFAPGGEEIIVEEDSEDSEEDEFFDEESNGYVS